MPRKPTAFNEDAFVSMRNLIRIKSNLNCSTFSEIQSLHEEILKVTNVSLSIQTLNRVLGIIRSDFKPSLHTLDTLAKYLNYHSFNHFEFLHETDSIAKINKSDFISSFLISLFSGINPMNENYSPDLFKNILKWMKINPHLNVEIYSSLAATGYSRKIFFDDFINIDAFNSGFGKGLHYCLLHAQNKHEKYNTYTLSCFRYFLNGQNEIFKKYFEIIRHSEHSEIINFSPQLLDRFYAIVILNQVISPRQEHHNGTTALIDYDMLTSASLSLSNSCYYVGEALLLTGEFSRAWEIFNDCNIKDLNVPECLKNEYALQIRIFKLISGFLSENISHRRTLSQYLEIYKLPLPFLQESYISLFLLALKYKLFTKPKVRKTVMETFEKIVEKTGFYYFNTFFEKIMNAQDLNKKKISSVKERKS